MMMMMIYLVHFLLFLHQNRSLITLRKMYFYAEVDVIFKLYQIL